MANVHDNDNDNDNDDESFVPLQDQRVFGAGIKRKRVPFVPASTLESTQPPVKTAGPSQQAGDRYLSIVFPNTTTSNEQVESVRSTAPFVLCTICKQPLPPTNGSDGTQQHESSIAHQVCLEHSHPPSHLDREHVGLKYLSGYGWDPDSRKGLGMREEGIRIPVKATVKHDTVGLGVELDKRRSVVVQDPDVRLNAKEIRKQDAEMKRKAERLRGEFYGKDWGEYLGPGG